jgi:hypothetical protein
MKSNDLAFPKPSLGRRLFFVGTCSLPEQLRQAEPRGAQASDLQEFPA